eukprot:SAG31_NODE_206_length_20335_cov_17.910160_6_plen_183_part_00
MSSLRVMCGYVIVFLLLHVSSRLKVLDKADAALKRIAQGLLVRLFKFMTTAKLLSLRLQQNIHQLCYLQANPDFPDTFLFRFCKLTIRDQLELGRKQNALAVAKKRTYEEASAVVDEDGKQLAERSELERNNAHYVIEFALGLLHVKLKRIQPKLRSELQHVSARDYTAVGHSSFLHCMQRR